MSLTKNIQNRYGSVTGYWKVARREFDDIAKRAEVIMYGYPSRDAFVAGAEKMEFRKLDLPYEDVRGLNARQMADYIIANVTEFNAGVPE